MGKEFKRMRYFDGLFLKAEDYNLEQNYYRRLQRLHNRYLHTWGIVEGLMVTPGSSLMSVSITEGIALNQVNEIDSETEQLESISQEILIYDGHPDNPIDLSEYKANDNIYILLNYEEVTADKNVEKGQGDEIHIWEKGHLTHSIFKPEDPKRNIILGRVVPKVRTVNGNTEIYIDSTCIYDVDKDGITPLRIYAGPAGRVIAMQKLIIKYGDDIKDMPFMQALENGNVLEINSPKTKLSKDVDVMGDLVVYGELTMKSKSNKQSELLISNSYVQVNSKPDDDDESKNWKPQDGGLQVDRGDENTLDAKIVWVENDKCWKAGIGNKLENIAYGNLWNGLIDNSLVDNLHRHSNISYPKGISLSANIGGDLFSYVDLAIKGEKTIWLKTTENDTKADTNNGIGWFGGGKPFANIEIDGPAVFGYSGGALGTTSGGQKATLHWNSLGNVGVGTINPKEDNLDVAGSTRILSKSNPIRFTGAWSGFPDAALNQAEISNDVTNYKALMIIGNQSSGQGRKVAIWDRLDVNGYLYINGSMAASQAITPSAGNGNNGIVFPGNPGGGSGDAAWIKYFPISGESCALQIGTSNDGDDNILLTPTGNVGIGTMSPADRLDVSGYVRMLSDSNPIRFTSSWSGFPDGGSNQAEICNDTAVHKALMIVGNKSANQGRKVAIWDRLDVNGFLFVNGSAQVAGNLNVGGAINAATLNFNGQIGKLDVAQNFAGIVRCADFMIGGFSGRRGSPGRALVDAGNCLVLNYSQDWSYAAVHSNLVVSGAITPSAGASDNCGIMFPRDPGGGSGDAAWIKYYSDSSRGGGENMTLDIGVSNDYYGWGNWEGGDRVYIHASGGVFIGGYWYYGSSRDYKEDISKLSTDSAKQLLDGLNPVSFKFKGETAEKKTMGFIAEDVPETLAAPNQKGISPMEIITVLTSVVKDQQKTLSRLQKKIAAIEANQKNN